MQAKSASEYFVFVCLSEKLDLALIAYFVKMISEKKKQKKTMVEHHVLAFLI